MKIILIPAMLLTFILATTANAYEKQENVDLPNVLIIGDSISIGYTPYVTQILKSKAIVKHNGGNAGPTIRGIANIENWLGTNKWDVIHFNWGLWDIYGWEYMKEDRSPSMYEKRLEQLVIRLKKTGAKLIWGTTTPVCPSSEVSMLKRFNSDTKITPTTERLYLDAALGVMKKYEIQVNDLHALMSPELKRYAIAANDVHYTEEGCEKLGRQVAEAIEKAIVRGQKNLEWSKKRLR